uniref:Uncharacterized protein n=1 Tax=Arundo donax TaxID=35708 RepID=A0A0A9GP02_ARUDO
MPSVPELLSRHPCQIHLELCKEAAAGHVGHMHLPLAAMHAVEVDKAPDIRHLCDPPTVHLVQLRLCVPLLHVLMPHCTDSKREGFRGASVAAAAAGPGRGWR